MHYRVISADNHILEPPNLFSIDYPHEISLFGSTQQVLAELTHGLDANVKHALLAGNAMHVYGLVDDDSESASISRAPAAVGQV